MEFRLQKLCEFLKNHKLKKSEFRKEIFRAFFLFEGYYKRRKYRRRYTTASQTDL